MRTLNSFTPYTLVGKKPSHTIIAIERVSSFETQNAKEKERCGEKPNCVVLIASPIWPRIVVVCGDMASWGQVKYVCLSTPEKQLLSWKQYDAVSCSYVSTYIGFFRTVFSMVFAHTVTEYIC